MEQNIAEWLKEQSDASKKESVIAKDAAKFFYYLGRKDLANEALLKIKK